MAWRNPKRFSDVLRNPNKLSYMAESKSPGKHFWDDSPVTLCNFLAGWCNISIFTARVGIYTMWATRLTAWLWCVHKPPGYVLQHVLFLKWNEHDASCVVSDLNMWLRRDRSYLHQTCRESDSSYVFPLLNMNVNTHRLITNTRIITK